MANDQTFTILGIFRDQITAPLAGVRRQFSGINTELKTLGGILAPLTGRLTQLAVTVVGVQAVKRSIDAAKEQAEAEKNLQAALNERVEIFKQISNLANEIQSKTSTGDEQILAIAGTLKEGGLAAQDIPKALQAAVDTAEALQVGIDSVVNDIIGFQTNQARFLSRRIPELRDLQRDSRLAAEGVDFLLSRFQGRAAENAETVFGRIDIALNKLGESFEKQGELFAGFKLNIVEGLDEQIAKFTEAFDTETGRGFLRLLSEMIGFITKIVVLLTALVGAGLLGKLVKLGLEFLGPLSKWLLAFVRGRLLLIAIIAAVAKLALSFEPVRSAVDSVVGKLREFFAIISKDGAEAENEIDRVRVQFQKVLVVLQDLVTLRTLRDVTTSTLSSLTVRVKQFVNEIAATIADISNDPDTANIIRTEIGARLERELNQSFENIETARTRLNDKLNKLDEELLDRQIERLVKEEQATKSALDKREVETARTFETLKKMVLEKDLRNTFVIELDTTKAREELDRLAEVFPDVINVGLRTIDVRSVLNLTLDQVKELSKLLDEETASALTNRVLSDIRRVANDEKVAIKTLIDVESQLRLDPLEERIRAKREELETLNTEIDLQIGFVDSLETATTQLESIEKAKTLQEEIIRLELQRASIETDLFDKRKEAVSTLESKASEILSVTEEEISDSLQKLSLGIVTTEDVLAQVDKAFVDSSVEMNSFIRVINSVTEEFPELSDEVDRAEEAIRRLHRQFQVKVALDLADTVTAQLEELVLNVERLRAKIRKEFDEGFVNPETIKEFNEAVAKLNTETARVLNDIIPQIKDKAPEAAAALETIADKIEDTTARIEERVNPSTQTLGTFFGAVRNGMVETTTRFADLASAGTRLGQELVTGLTDALVTLFVDGKAKFEEFVGAFLIGIGKMLIQLAIFRALAATLNFIFPGAGTAAAIASGVATGETGGLASEMDTVVLRLRGKYQNLVDVAEFGGGGYTGNSARSVWPFVPPNAVDVLPAWLARKEFVMPEHAVDYYSIQVFEAMRQRKIPREIFEDLHISTTLNLPNMRRAFAEGGSVGGSGSAASAPVEPIRAMVVLDENELDRALRAHPKVVERAVQRTDTVSSFLTRRVS